MSLIKGYVISDLEKYFRSRKALMKNKLDESVLTSAEHSCKYVMAMFHIPTPCLKDLLGMVMQILHERGDPDIEKIGEVPIGNLQATH